MVILTFAILAGVLEDDKLAPFLSIITLGHAVRTYIEGYEDMGFTLEDATTKWTVPSSDNYGYDIGLILDTLDKAHTFLARVETAAGEVG